MHVTTPVNLSTNMTRTTRTQAIRQDRQVA